MSYTDGVKKIANELMIDSGSVLVTGATGLIGSCIIDVLLEANKERERFNIYALSRSENKVRKRFGNLICPIIQNINTPIDDKIKFDYIIHCASNADPMKYSTEPVETILTNVVGSKNIFEYCKKHKNTRLLFTSSFEVYGQIDGVSVFEEEMTGIIDQNILRNCYPESKRTCELLLKSYVDEYDINGVIARLPSVFGPTMIESDSKAHAQFIRNAINREDIVLKSSGEQIRSYCYVIDVVSGIFTILSKGKIGETYNISNENSISSIANIAQKCAEIASTKVIYDLPNEVEKKGFSRGKNCILNNSKLKALGWQGCYTLENGLKDTIEYLINNSNN